MSVRLLAEMVLVLLTYLRNLGFSNSPRSRLLASQNARLAEDIGTASHILDNSALSSFGILNLCSSGWLVGPALGPLLFSLSSRSLFGSVLAFLLFLILWWWWWAWLEEDLCNERLTLLICTKYLITFDKRICFPMLLGSLFFLIIWFYLPCLQTDLYSASVILIQRSILTSIKLIKRVIFILIDVG